MLTHGGARHKKKLAFRERKSAKCGDLYASECYTKLTQYERREYMYRVNAPKIRGKMSEKGYTIASLAQGIGVNRNTLAAYLEHPEKIPFGKLLMMADLLCDTPCEAALIFLIKTYVKRKL